jgi:Ni,Fe-hydrogenase III large subunit
MKSAVKSTNLLIHNGGSAPASRLPLLPMEEMRRQVIAGVKEGAEIAAFFARPVAATASAPTAFQLIAVLVDRSQGALRVLSTRLGNTWPSITPECPSAHLFEREIAEQWNLAVPGHPWLKPVRFAPAMPGALPGAIRESRPGALPEPRPGVALQERPAIGDAPFFRVEGEEVHEVAVGPVHAGVIEPGHFRFQCHGETVLHLEISLGYQHRGIERALAGGPDARSIHYAETLAGDTTIGHATAYCEAVEALCGREAPPRAQALRAIALELERIANHVGDLGALSGDIGFLPTASWCGRIRGDVLNMSALLCGSRFGRGLARPGGVAFDVDGELIGELKERIRTGARDAAGACELLWKTPSVLARFEGTGALSQETAREIGLTGPAARACGVERDVRSDLPTGIWRFTQVPASTWRTGDVFARAYVRWLEVQRSFAFIQEQLEALPSGDLRVSLPKPARSSLAVSLVEGWRGAICHVVMTDAEGRFGRYKVVDPSFRDWFGLALAMRGQPVSDFPLCNKSFNLSYCGHDL